MEGGSTAGTERHPHDLQSKVAHEPGTFHAGGLTHNNRKDIIKQKLINIIDGLRTWVFIKAGAGMFNYITFRQDAEKKYILSIFFAKNERESNITVREIVEKLDEPEWEQD